MVRTTVMILAVLIMAVHANAAGIGLLLPGQDYKTEARSVLARECAKLILTDNSRTIFITCDLKNGDLITANAKLGGAVFSITYRTPSEMGRPQFVVQVLEALGFEGAGEACMVHRRPAECWTRGEETLEIPVARDPAGRWVAVHEDMAHAS